MSEQHTEDVANQLPAIKITMDNNRIGIFCSFLENANPKDFANVMYKLNHGLLIELMMQAISNYGKITKQEEKTNVLLDELVVKWKSDTPAICPTKVFGK